MAKVILIEADRPLAAVVSKFLEACGHKVQWHVDAQAAMDSADSTTPDVVILDLMLAGRSGVEFLYEFRSYPDWQDLPVVIYSNVSPGDLGASLNGFEQLNVSHFLYKPTTSLAELDESIRQILPAAKVRT